MAQVAPNANTARMQLHNTMLFLSIAPPRQRLHKHLMFVIHNEEQCNNILQSFSG